MLNNWGLLPPSFQRFHQDSGYLHGMRLSWLQEEGWSDGLGFPNFTANLEGD